MVLFLPGYSIFSAIDFVLVYTNLELRLIDDEMHVTNYFEDLIYFDMERHSTRDCEAHDKVIYLFI